MKSGDQTEACLQQNPDSPSYDINLQDNDLNIVWNYPDVGTCGNGIDKIQVDVMRCASIPPIAIGYDLESEEWVIYERGEEMEWRENARLELRDLK